MTPSEIYPGRKISAHCTYIYVLYSFVYIILNSACGTLNFEAIQRIHWCMILSAVKQISGSLEYLWLKKT